MKLACMGECLERSQNSRKNTLKHVCQTAWEWPSWCGTRFCGQMRPRWSFFTKIQSAMCSVNLTLANEHHHSGDAFPQQGLSILLLLKEEWMAQNKGRYCMWTFFNPPKTEAWEKIQLSAGQWLEAQASKPHRSSYTTKSWMFYNGKLEIENLVSVFENNVFMSLWKSLLLTRLIIDTCTVCH